MLFIFEIFAKLFKQLLIITSIFNYITMVIQYCYFLNLKLLLLNSNTKVKSLALDQIIFLIITSILNNFFHLYI